MITCKEFLIKFIDTLLSWMKFGSYNNPSPIISVVIRVQLLHNIYIFSTC